MSVVPADDTPEHGAGHGATLATGAVLNVLAFLTSNLRAIFTFLVARLLGGATLGTFGVGPSSTWRQIRHARSRFERHAVRGAIRGGCGPNGHSGDLQHCALGRGWRRTPRRGGAQWSSRSRPGTRWSPQRPGDGDIVMFLAVPGIVLYRVSNGLSRGLKLMRHDVYSRGLTESLVTAGALLVAVALGARLLAPVYAAIAGTLASGSSRSRSSRA